jgi:hypothetical protein
MTVKGSNEEYTTSRMTEQRSTLIIPQFVFGENRGDKRERQRTSGEACPYKES